MYTFEQLHKLEKLLECCVTKYMQAVLPDVVIHITLGEMPNRSQLKVIDAFTPPFHVPLIYDTYRLQGETAVVYCMNIPEEVALLALDDGVYSYPRFILQNIFEQLDRGRCQSFEQFVERIESVTNRPLAVMMHSASVQFAEQLFATLQPQQGTSFDQVYLFDILDSISTMDYEGVPTFSKILFIHKDYIHCVKFHVRFEQAFSLSSFRQVRKILEVAKSNLFVIADHETIYGIGELHSSCTDALTHCFFISFIGRNTYKATKLYKKKHDATIQEVLIYFSSHKNMTLQSLNYEKDELDYAIHTTFHHYFAEQGRHYQQKIEALSKTIAHATKQKLGTMIVIAPPTLTKREVKRLARAQQAIRIEPIPLAKSELSNEQLIAHLTSIDGAIYIDAENTCHAIGVILDGVVTSQTEGRSDRGARYNAAVKYFSRKAIAKNCLIAIISEDGMIDLLFPQTAENVRTYFTKIYVAFSQQHYEEVVFATSQLLEHYAHYYPFYLYRGIASYYLGHYDVAKKDLLKASSFQQNEPMIYYWLGVVKRTLGEYESALKKFSLAIALKEQESIFYLEKALTYTYMNNMTSATHHLQKAARINDANPLLYYYNGYLYETQHAYDEALQCYMEAIALDALQPSFHLACARIYIQKQQFAEAMDEIIQALRLQPLDETLYRRVERMLKMPEFDSYFHAHLQNSKHYALYIVAGFRDLKRGLPETALAYFEYAQNVIRKTSFVYEWIGDCCWELNDLKKAYHVYSTALLIHSHDVKVLLKRANVAIALGEYTLAKKDLETAYAYTNEPTIRAQITQKFHDEPFLK
ncbi:MAG: diadenylate cyclase [Caryophanon sp.]|nr:diadenylate cyclase [Caryophanon sp.]